MSDTKQAKSLVFIVVPPIKKNKFQSTKKKKKKESDVDVINVIRTYNNSSYKLT